MKAGDKIIWDSRWGYDIGYFIEHLDFETVVDLRSGICTGEVRLRTSDIKPYSDELVAELTKRYGYEKSFSKTF